jgi:hypothetical protein
MKIATRLLGACLISATLFFAACNYVKPVMYIQVVNSSGHPMRNLELKYPTGTFGLPELRDNQTHRHMAPIGAPCKFSLAFEDQAGKKYTKDFDLGATCPLEIAFQIDSAMQVSERTVRQ